MKKNLTEIVFILDRSGSMAGLEADTIGGFNSLVERQKTEAGEALVSTVLFDNESQVLHDRVPLDRIPVMTRRDYCVRGCTALLDAVGGAIAHIGMVHRYIREEDRPEKTLFVITTDGMENASRSYTYDRVRSMIEEKKALGWEFLFLGANIDAAREAARFGISPDFAADYHADSRGTATVYTSVNEAIRQVRHCPAAPISGSWKKSVDEDYKKRRR